jgi:hypothetical protein
VPVTADPLPVERPEADEDEGRRAVGE